MSRKAFPCHDRVRRPGARPGLCAHGLMGLARNSLVCARATRSLGPTSRLKFCVAIGFGLGLDNKGRGRGFAIATKPLGHQVATVDYVATGYGQGREALCRNMETVSQQGAKPPRVGTGLRGWGRSGAQRQSAWRA